MTLFPFRANYCHLCGYYSTYNGMYHKPKCWWRREEFILVVCLSCHGRSKMMTKADTEVFQEIMEEKK